MNFDNLIDKDITVHTTNSKFRGVLKTFFPKFIDQGATRDILEFKMGIDEFYLYSDQVIAVTVHGREFGTEVKGSED
jgi:hypothetical protein